MALPGVTKRRLVVALAIHPEEEDLEKLRSAGWVLVDPVEVAGTPSLYQGFIRGSRAELAIAKSGYVLSKCGWFSDRSACYLASGKPVIAEDTGFSKQLPCGKGLFSFEDQEGLLQAMDDIESNYEQHSMAAVEMAREFFDSDKVLSRLLTLIGA
jgi:hypothetical protein